MNNRRIDFAYRPKSFEAFIIENMCNWYILFKVSSRLQDLEKKVLLPA